MRAFVVLLLAGIAVLCQSGSIQRNKRGYLSRTGLCVNPADNFKIKDPRLNFWGVAYVLPDDANPKCTESECSEDSHCDADRKCCKNYCGGMVCTPTMRDPNPCKKFQCPVGQTCKIQYVPCVMPKCKDAIAVNRPTCVKDPNAVPPPAPPAAPPAVPPASPPVLPPVAPGYPEQSSFAPSLYNQQPLAYQPQPQQYPQAPQASFMPQQPMAPLPPPMPPMSPMSAYQNDEPGSEANAPAGFTGNQPDLETGVNDAPLAKALQNENQPLAFQNDSPLPSDQSNFLPPPPEAREQQQPLVNEPAITPPAANPMIAPQPRWDRSTSFQ